jgi:hypothetical protein
MTNEEKRIAIAEAIRGEKYYTENGQFYRWHTEECPQPFDRPCRKGGWLVRINLPDYLGDLNAAIELPAHLATQGWWCELANGLDGTWECEFMRAPTPNTDSDHIGERRNERLEIHYAGADILPLAIGEAFLRTLNLWKD